jgi:hypothetical protein
MHWNGHSAIDAARKPEFVAPIGVARSDQRAQEISGAVSVSGARQFAQVRTSRCASTP